MAQPGGRRRRPKSSAHETLGRALRKARLAAEVTTRGLGFSSGHVSNVEGGFVTPSAEFVDAYVGLGADRAHLEALLDEVLRHKAVNRSGGSIAPQAVDGDTRGPDVRRHYAVERYDVEFVFDERGAIRQVQSSVDIRATSDQVRFYYSGHSVDEGHRARAPRVSVLGGGTLERINTSPLGAFNMFFRVDQPLHLGGTHTLTYVVEIDDDWLADAAIMYVAPPAARRHSLTARFEASALPERLWCFAGPDSIQVEHPSPTAELEPTPDGAFTSIFEPLVTGWVYGFNWLWPAHLTG